MAITLDGSTNNIAIGANATGSSFLRLYEDTDNGSNYIDLIAPSSVGSNRVLTLPDSTTTIVGTDAAQTLTNKTLGSGLVMGASATTLETAKAYNWNGLTTNTSLGFTGLPSWVKRIVVMFLSVSTNGTSSLQVQLGTGSTPTYITSGYLGSVVTTGGTATSFSAAFSATGTITAGRVMQGQLILTNITGNSWVESSIIGFSDANGGNWAAGSIALSDQLTAIRVTTASGTDTFDAGTVNILYE
jgi:hypothetical protein